MWDLVGATIDSIHTLVGSVILAELVLLLTVILLTLSGQLLTLNNIVFTLFSGKLHETSKNVQEGLSISKNSATNLGTAKMRFMRWR
jgi:hypothetical protein